MQLIQAVEHPGQGRLVAQLALQGGYLGVPRHGANMDLHPLQPVRPTWVDRTLYADMVRTRLVIKDMCSRRGFHYDYILVWLPAQKQHQKVQLKGVVKL